MPKPLQEYRHKSFNSLTKFELDNYLELVSHTMQSINSLEVFDVENDPTPEEYKERAFEVFKSIIDVKERIEGEIIQQEHENSMHKRKPILFTWSPPKK